MQWYEVTKTIKGRKYRYRQRTYRVGGKVKTESHYLGPAGPVMSGTVNVASLDAAEAGAIAIGNRSQSEPGEVAEAHSAPSLVVDDFMHYRSDVSVPALFKEAQQVDELMRQQGVNTTNLKPIKVERDWKVWRRERANCYVVYGTYEGQRTAFKREFRRALAERWIGAIKEQHPERYQRLCEMIAVDLSWFSSGAKPQWLALLSDLWHQRRRGHREAVEMAAEMLQRGCVETQAKYYHKDGETEAAETRAWKKFERLKRPASRQHQFVEWKRLKGISTTAGEKHLQAMWVRSYLFGERPVLSRKEKRKAKPAKKRRVKQRRYRRRRYPRWSR